MIIRSRIVVPVVGDPIENGAVAINGNMIAGVGRFEEIQSTYQGDLIDLGEQILLPGLINAHCHLDYTMLRQKIPPQATFSDWVRALNTAKAGLNEEDYLTAITAGLQEAQMFGTTAMVNLEAFPQLLPRLQETPLRVWWCAEMIDVRAPVLVDRVFDDLQEWLRSRPGFLGGIGLAPHAPYTASQELFSQAAALGRKHNILFTTHLAESRDEMQMFRDGSGPLFHLLQEIGRPMDDCRKETPVSLFTRTQQFDQQWIIAHLNEVTEDDFDRLARQKRFHVVHCPSSHAFFRHTPFPLRRFEQLGFNVCLGTDSLASSSSLSLFSEMRALLQGKHSASPRDAVMMVTVNGAKAIGMANHLGRISPGSRADLIAIPCPRSDQEVFEAIVTFEEKVKWMMIEGRIICQNRDS